jgi:hypothetical protein
MVAGSVLALITMHDARAATNTAEIAINTVSAVPSCLQYKVKGTCFWLKCTSWPPKCAVRTTLRIEHYVPEVVVSTWHEPLAHPWLDYGRPIAAGMGGVGSALLALPIDSAGTRTSTSGENRNRLFRDADAIGNPLGALNFLLSGSFPSLATPGSIPFPTTAELFKFPSTMSSIAGSWANVPQNAVNGTLNQIKSLANVPGKISQLGGQLGSLPGKISSISTSFGNLNNLMSQGASIVGASGQVSPSLPSLRSLIDVTPLGIVQGLFCPPTSTPFALHYQSVLDALFWRNVIPAELIYPDSWIPGINEVGNFPKNTWGSLYPRSGETTQPIPIKGSAVLAQRVASIISRTAQPHVYSPLSQKGDFKYFSPEDINPNDPANSKWQRLYPMASSSCEAFGANDSASLTSWGDGHSTSEESYAWNLWRRAECCKRDGSYVGSVTW